MKKKGMAAAPRIRFLKADSDSDCETKPIANSLAIGFTFDPRVALEWLVSDEGARYCGRLAERLYNVPRARL